MPKKKTVKKAAKKAVKKAAKKAVKKEVHSRAGFEKLPEFGKEQNLVAGDGNLDDILAGDDNLFRNVETLVERKRSRRKNRPVNLSSLSSIRKRMLPLREFNMQYAIGSYGIPFNSLVSLVGPEGIGKTTLLFYLMGCCIRAGGLCYYQETESKLIARQRALRALSSDLPTAKKMMDRIFIEEVHSLRISEEYMRDWVDTVRNEQGLPIDKPILVCVDTWSKLMSDAEALGYYNVGTHVKTEKNSKKAKGIKEGSNLGHSSFASDWCRRLTAWLPENNVILILGEHQNEKIDMNAGKSPVQLPQSYVNKHNKTKIGGRAFNQNAALQMIVTQAGECKYPDKSRSGTKVNFRVEKNSYGPRSREFNFEHRDEHRQDSGNYHEEAFVFDESLANLLMDHKLFGLKAREGLYTSEELGIIGATSQELHRAFYANPENIQKAGKLLKVEGYYDIYEESENYVADEPKEDLAADQRDGESSPG